jgi:ABC-type transport system involved in multi-copper enzyme maturation permease subunit
LLRTIIKREFLDNILSFKFIACVLVAIVLTAISTVILADNYRDRLDDYGKGMASARDALSRVPAYSFLAVSIYKKPSLLSIFAPGIESKSGSFVTLTHREIPSSLKGGLKKNEFASIFSFFDLSSIVIGIFSILAILLAYGSISGEKESGMLSLALSHAVPRVEFLAGKYLGGIISLAVAVLACFLAGPLILLFSKGVALDPGFFRSLLLICLFSLLYLSSVLLFGILVSSLTKSSFQSLIIVLAFYLVAVFLLPLAINSAADGAAAHKARNYDRNIDALMIERSASLEKAELEIPVKRSWAFMNWNTQTDTVILGRLNPPETIAHYESLFERTEKLKEEYAQRIYALREEDLRVREKIDRVRNGALALLPPSCFVRAAELEAGTGREGLDRFFRRLALYWRQYVRYLDEKKAFSLRYAYPYPKELPPADKALVDELERVWLEKKAPFWASPAFGDVGKLNKQYEREIKPLDLGDLPVFNFERGPFAQRLGFWLMNVLILAIDNILLFALAHFAFARYDPRMET